MLSLVSELSVLCAAIVGKASLINDGRATDQPSSRPRRTVPGQPEVGLVTPVTDENAQTAAYALVGVVPDIVPDHTTHGDR